MSVPLGCISTLLPQNLILGWIDPWKRKAGDSAWNAETGGWWLTCSQTILQIQSNNQFNPLPLNSIIKVVLHRPPILNASTILSPTQFNQSNFQLILSMGSDEQLKFIHRIPNCRQRWKCHSNTKGPMNE